MSSASCQMFVDAFLDLPGAHRKGTSVELRAVVLAFLFRGGFRLETGFGQEGVKQLAATQRLGEERRDNATLKVELEVEMMTRRQTTKGGGNEDGTT